MKSYLENILLVQPSLGSYRYILGIPTCHQELDYMVYI